ncbi:hypothetical protein BDN70DRAFT_887066 [Pholiota conissans]|uniref:Uncharacterized protein n=1 Tax=Pholiota conissans TaxID=109636 RepID=A0A9P5YR02_9AGAR|nr:hypothetical protein BDN70DRAFT_887066 [Pholiota conissans]
MLDRQGGQITTSMTWRPVRGLCKTDAEHESLGGRRMRQCVEGGRLKYTEHIIWAGMVAGRRST